MSRKIILFLFALIAVCCLCTHAYADNYTATKNTLHAFANTASRDFSVYDSTITKKGGPSGTVSNEYEYRGVNSAAFLSNDVFTAFNNVILRSHARYAQGVFLLGSSDTTYLPTATLTSTDIATYEEHSDGAYNSNATIDITTSQIATGKLGASSYSPAITAYGKAASTVLTGVCAWTSGDNSPVLKVYGTGSPSNSNYHLSVNTPPENYTNDFYSYGQDSPVLYSTGRVRIYDAAIGADCSAGVVIDGSGQVYIYSTSIDLAHTYAPTTRTVEHPAVQIGSTTSGDASFFMSDGHIATDAGDVFLVKGTNANITLSGVKITNNDTSANLLKAEASAKINSSVNFAATNQSIAGSITAATGSSIDVYLSGKTVFTGSVNKGGAVDLTMQKESSASAPAWYLTASSYVSSLTNTGKIIAGPYKLYVNNSLYTSADALADGGTFYADYDTEDSKIITINTLAIPSGKTGSMYLAYLEAESESAFKWEIADGSLPDGLSLDQDSGTISGIPETAGSYLLTVEAFSDSYITAQQYMLVITDGSASSIKIETTKLNDASTYSAYSAALAASGAGTVVWSIESGFSLPGGLSLDKNTGIISGIPKRIGTYTFMVRASVASSTYFDTKLLTLKVVEGSDVFTIITDKLKDGTVGKTYSVVLKAKGSGTLSWSAEGLPDGLGFSSAGKISGKPAEAGTYNTVFTVTNGTESATSTLAIIVKDVKPKIKASIKAGIIDTSYLATFTTTAGTGTITWELSGDLPNGLSFDAENVTISGKPTEGWKGNIVIMATNSGGTTSKTCKLQIKAIKPKFTLKKIPVATYGEYCEIEAGLTGSQPIALEVTGLPEGLSYDYNTFDEVVKISGIPSTGGKFSLKMTASNSQGKSSKSGKIVVNFPPTIQNLQLATAYTGKSYTAKFAADGTKKITWALIDGSIPEGLTFNGKNGQLKGKAKQGGTFSFTLEAANAYGKDTKSFDLLVKVTPPKIATSSIKKGKYNKAYSVKLKTKDGTPDIWDIDGDLPAGITFDNGVFSGTPTEAFSGKITVTASNGGGSDSKTYTLQIAADPPKITTSSLPDGTLGRAYSAELEATGTPVITWEWSGSPDGLTLNTSTGKISGIPTKAGKFNITVTAENDSKRVTKKYKVEIADPNNGAVQDVGELGEDGAIDEQGLSAEKYTATEELPDEFVIVAEIPEVSVDVSGMYDFDVTLSESAPIGAKMYWVANSEKHSDDDDIAEFFGMDGQEIYAVPESRKVSVSAWLNAGVIYRPVIAVK